MWMRLCLNVAEMSKTVAERVECVNGKIKCTKKNVYTYMNFIKYTYVYFFKCALITRKSNNRHRLKINGQIFIHMPLMQT